jgi:hypothetical protein
LIPIIEKLPRMNLLTKTTFLLFLLTSKFVLGQTPGFNYQALILNTADAEIPGTDFTEKTALAKEDIVLRFSITTANSIEYIEEHEVTTSANGMVSVIVGEGIPITSTFDKINWDGDLKYVEVEIDILSNRDGFVFLDAQKILYIPHPTKLGGILTEPTEITTSVTNTLAIKGLEPSVLTNDEIVMVEKETGILRRKSVSSLIKREETVFFAIDNQSQFKTPNPINNPAKLDIYRNGIRIDFTVIDANTIELETICYANDKIRIVQLY